MTRSVWSASGLPREIQAPEAMPMPPLVISRGEPARSTPDGAWLVKKREQGPRTPNASRPADRVRRYSQDAPSHGGLRTTDPTRQASLVLIGYAMEANIKPGPEAA